MLSPFFTLIPASFLLSHCPSQCEVHCWAGLMQCQGPADPPWKNPHVQFQFSSFFHHSPYLIKSALSGSWALETALWGPWTSKTNADPSMWRLEADSPCGFCTYGENARRRRRRAETYRRSKKSERWNRGKSVRWVEVVCMKIGEGAKRKKWVMGPLRGRWDGKWRRRWKR